MKRVDYTVIYEEGEGHWGAYVPDLPGCTSTGTTFAEAEEHIGEAIALWIEDATESGEAIPLPTTRAAESHALIPA